MRHPFVFLLLLGIPLVFGRAAAEDGQRLPVYVGARVCAECHEGRGMGHQFSTWLLTRHARAYASLALPEARQMAVLSGIPGDPQQAPACLGCHATAFEAEEWEKDPTFFIEDGVQCERCHGPGSEYMAAEVMSDPEAAKQAGLRFTTERECLLCHYAKGSHVAVHHKPALDMKLARRRIDHAAPDKPVPGSLPRPVSAVAADDPGPKYVGVQVCAGCHKGAAMGYQFSHWRLSAHARAYAVLATPAAKEIAKENGVNGDPQVSPDCLVCHTTPPGPSENGFLDSYSVADGVGCESCHGAGSEYVAEAIMHDPRAAYASGLKRVTPETCMACHEQAHGKTFDVDSGLEQIAHPTRPIEKAQAPLYKTPVNLALSPDGNEIYVACEASGTVVVVDTRKRRMVSEIQVGGLPHDVTFSPDGETAYVTNRLDDSVSVIDVGTRQVRATLPVGESVSVFETATGEEIKRLSASRNPWSLDRSADGERILVTNNLSRFVEFRTPPLSEVTVIDADQAVIEDRIVVPETNLLQGVSWHPAGEFALITLNRTKNLVPMTRVLQGWTITNGLGVLWRDGRVDQVLLDEPNLYFPDAADVVITPDGRYALVTSSGSDRVAVVDISRLVSMLERASANERARVIPNHLGKSSEFVVKHIPTANSPRGILVDNDGRTAFVVNALDDSLTVIDLERLESVGRIDLGGPEEITQARWGERLFHSADIAFQRQFSCHSCHPDGHVDGITYDIEPDGIGFDPVDNRTLRGIRDTAPFKWTGKNLTLRRQCGPRLAVFFTRIAPFDPDELAAVERYISSIPRPPNRHRPLGADLTDAQRRGKRLFERTATNGGSIIPEDGRCVSCHFPPLYTDRSRRDVGTGMWLDRNEEFDVPHLSNIYDSAPYMHNGIAETLEEIWTRYNPDDRHGVTNDLTKDQLNDLIEYLKTL
jgi:YVTN family beta-propeller protein